MFNKIRILLRYKRKEIFRFIHPTARVCRKTSLLFPLHLAKDCVLKRCSLASYSYVARGSVLVGVSVDRYSSIGPECLIGGLGKHPTDYFSTSPLTYSTTNPISIALNSRLNHIGLQETADVLIEQDVWIGARCLISDGVTIGRGAIIGANTIVTKDVPPYAVYYGSPPKIKRFRFSPEIIARLESSVWWLSDPGQINYAEMEKIVGWKLPQH